MLEVTLCINIHVHIVMRLMSVNHPDIFIHVSPNTGVYLQELVGLMKKLQTVISTTSIAHRIENPLRRTSEHITLHDLKH